MSRESFLNLAAPLLEKTPDVIKESVGDELRNTEFFTFASVPYSLKAPKGTRVFGGSGVPECEKPQGGFPAVVLVHGGDGSVDPAWIKYWTDKGFIAIAPDIYSNSIKLENGEKTKIANPLGGPDEKLTGSLFDSPANIEDSWMFHAVAAVIACHNILRAREDVNREKIFLTGISWGGVVCCVAAGVDGRFAAAAPVYACGYLTDEKFWQYADFGGDKDAWLDTYDPSSYLPLVGCPMLFVSGIEDRCFSPVGRKKSVSLAKKGAYCSMRSDLTHGYYWFKTYEIYHFFRSIAEGTPVVCAGKAERIGQTVVYDLGGKETDAALLYTTSAEQNSLDWKFVREAGQRRGDKIIFTLPKGAKAYAVEAKFCDIDPEFRMSSEIAITGEEL